MSFGVTPIPTCAESFRVESKMDNTITDFSEVFISKNYKVIKNGFSGLRKLGVGLLNDL